MCVGSIAQGKLRKLTETSDAQIIELTRKVSAMEAQIEQIVQRNGILRESIQTPNSKYSSVMNNLRQ